MTTFMMFASLAIVALHLLFRKPAAKQPKQDPIVASFWQARTTLEDREWQRRTRTN